MSLVSLEIWLRLNETWQLISHAVLKLYKLVTKFMNFFGYLAFDDLQNLLSLCVLSVGDLKRLFLVKKSRDKLLQTNSNQSSALNVQTQFLRTM